MEGIAISTRKIQTVEMHLGHPLRIIVSGAPSIMGSTILEKRRYVQQNFDHLRTMLMMEPRGHREMCGALLLEKDNDEADFAVLMIYNDLNGGYSTMCGHGTICLGRFAIDYKLVKPVSPETPVKIQFPCGLVTAYTEYNAETGKTGRTRFESVPAFAFAINQTIEVDGYGEVHYDIGYGGAFYAYVDTSQFPSLDLKDSSAHELMSVAKGISKAVKKQVKLFHPKSADLAFLRGTILTSDTGEISYTYTQCILGDGQVDRSPCGSGVTGKIAVLFYKKQIRLDEQRHFVNAKTGAKLTAKPLEVVPYGCYDNAVRVEVSGHGYYTGESSFWQEEDDPLRNGFLVN